MKRRKDEFEYTDIVIKMHELEMSMLPAQRELRESCVLSEGFYERMDRLMERMSRRERSSMGFRYAAAMMALLVGLYFLFHIQYLPQAAEKIMDWTREYINFKFEEQLDEVVVPEYRLGYVPEGYTLMHISHSENSGHAVYRNGDKMLAFDYGRSDTLISVDNSGKEYRQLVLEDGTEVHYLVDTAGEEGSMIWLSEDGALFFYINGEFPEEELLKIMKHIILKK